MRAPTMFLALKLVRYGLTLSIRFLASSLERRQFLQYSDFLGAI